MGLLLPARIPRESRLRGAAVADADHAFSEVKDKVPLLREIERFLGVLLEHYAGALPPWLAPVQVVGIPIADTHIPYMEEVAARLRSEGIRVEVDSSDDRMQKKIRNAQMLKIPYLLLAGDEDISGSAVSFRYRNGGQKNGVPIDAAISEIVTAVETHQQV